MAVEVQAGGGGGGGKMEGGFGGSSSFIGKHLSSAGVLLMSAHGVMD